MDAWRYPDRNQRSRAEQWHLTLSRNARRAVLTVTPELRLDGEVIRTGAQISAQLQAAAAVLAAPGAAVPDWAKTGNEERLIS